MKDLQELKTWLDAERSKAYDEMQNERGFDREEYNLFKGMYQAFDLCFDKAELLLNPQSNKDAPPQLNKHDCSTQLPPLSDYDIRMLFYNNSDCYADSPDVIPAVTIDKFTEILRKISGRQLS